jgi:3-methyladenine DNA glycosylase Tag
MQDFEKIVTRAAERKGGMQALQALLPDTIKTADELAAIPDDRWLSGMTKAIFKAGFVWKIIENKWAGFEEAFWGFDIGRCAFMSPEDEDQLCADSRIIRNRQKILTVPHNAVMINEIRKKHDSFGRFVADWPAEDFVGLLEYLGMHGSRLGGMTAQYFLRFIGKDGFVLSRDGVYALIEAGIIDKPPTGKAARRKVQQTYNRWHQESGLGLAEISRVLALSIDAPQN